MKTKRHSVCRSRKSGRFAFKLKCAAFKRQIIAWPAFRRAKAHK